MQEYAYRNVLSNAKIQLMSADLPHIDYSGLGKGKKSRAQLKREYAEAVRANEEIMRRQGVRPEPEEDRLTEQGYKQVSLSELISRNNGK